MIILSMLDALITLIKLGIPPGATVLIVPLFDSSGANSALLPPTRDHSINSSCHDLVDLGALTKTMRILNTLDNMITMIKIGNLAFISAPTRHDHPDFGCHGFGVLDKAVPPSREHHDHFGQSTPFSQPGTKHQEPRTNYILPP